MSAAGGRRRQMQRRHEQPARTHPLPDSREQRPVQEVAVDDQIVGRRRDGERRRIGFEIGDVGSDTVSAAGQLRVCQQQ